VKPWQIHLRLGIDQNRHLSRSFTPYDLLGRHGREVVGGTGSEKTGFCEDLLAKT